MSGTRTLNRADHVHAKLLETLSDVDRPGDVCASGDLPLTMPGLEVTELGPLRLPLGTTQARKLIKVCRQAPYGKGTETLVDTDVRRVWELDPGQFQLTNPKWDQLVGSIVGDVQEALGLTGQKLTAQLYNLLVYEKGGFFLPHRDGEKLDRMVATLVIGLPAVHEGGELLVSHDGRQYEIVFRGAASGHELSYAAFYADCKHEIRPVRSGYRLCLTYNVTLAKSRRKQGVGAPSYGSTTASIAERLGDWRDQDDSKKLAVTLEHRYTQNGLTIDKLKGIDRARAQVLFEAAKQADCVAHLALVTLWQCGAAEGGYDDYSHGRGRWHRWSDDDDEGYGETSNDYSMGEVYDWSLTADHWSDREGKKVRFGQIGLVAEEIVSGESLDDAEPNQEEFEGYTGNAGMTLERWYHRAAVVIWPRAKHFQVLCGVGTDAAVGGFEIAVKRLARAAKKSRDKQRHECLSFATAIIDAWQQASDRPFWEETKGNRDVFASSLCKLDEPELVHRFLSNVMPGDGAVQLDKSFAKFCKQHGWAEFEAELTALLNSTSAATIARNAKLLQLLCTVRDKDAERQRLCVRLSEQIVKAVQKLDNTPAKHDWRIREVDRADSLVSLVTAMLAAAAEKPLRRLMDHAFACDKYDLTDAHLAAIFALEKRLMKLAAPSKAVETWLKSCHKELESRTAESPRKPSDYRRASELSCKCEDCRALAAFLDDPNQRQARFPLSKPRRQHLHQIMDGNRCDCTHVTERRGRPYTLVCTKTTASYQAACKIHDRDLKNLARVVAIEKKTG